MWGLWGLCCGGGETEISLRTLCTVPAPLLHIFLLRFVKIWDVVVSYFCSHIWANLAWSHHYKMQNASSWKSQCKLHRVFVILEAVSPFGEPAVHPTSHPFADQLFIPWQSWVVVIAMFVCHNSPYKYKSPVLFGSKSCRRISPWVLLQQRFYE